MATGTAGTAARQHPLQMVHFLRKRVTFADTGISSGLSFANYLPAGAEILYTIVKVKTAFNAGTTNVLTVGQNASSYNDMVAAGDVDESVAESQQVLRGADLTLSADALPFVKYTQTGTAATAGVAEVIIFYVPDNDE